MLAGVDKVEGRIDPDVALKQGERVFEYSLSYDVFVVGEDGIVARKRRARLYIQVVDAEVDGHGDGH